MSPRATWLGRTAASLAVLALPAGLAFGADSAESLVRICYHGTESTVAPNVLQDYLSDGATMGTCAQADAARTVQAQAQATASSSSSSAASAQPLESAAMTLQAQDAGSPGSSSSSEQSSWQSSLDWSQQDNSDQGNTHMTVSISTNLNGQRSDRRQVWENGRLVEDTAAGVQLDLSNPLAGLGIFGF
jgi:hypothetical protein